MAKKALIIATTEYYHSCPVHDGGSQSSPRFFYKIKDLLKYIKENMNERGVLDCYSPSGRELQIIINYEYGRHAFTGCVVKIKGRKYRLIDNGSGDKIWINE